MTVQAAVDARAVGERYAREVRDVPGVRELWVRPNRGWIDVWLLTGPLDADAERWLYGASAVIYRDFPGTHYRLHILNPANYDEVPNFMEEIPLDALSIDPRG